MEGRGASMIFAVTQNKWIWVRVSKWLCISLFLLLLLSEFCVWGWRGRQKYLRVCRPRPNHRHAAGNRPLSPALSQKEREMLVITQMTHRRHSYIFSDAKNLPVTYSYTTVKLHLQLCWQQMLSVTVTATFVLHQFSCTVDVWVYMYMCFEFILYILLLQ